jgi:hypothetical protein
MARNTISNKAFGVFSLTEQAAPLLVVTRDIE